MTTPVNPPPQLRIPESFQKDRETFGYIRQINQILFQLWTRTGGANDVVTGSTEGLTQFEDLQNFTGRIVKLERNPIAASADYTTTDNDVVICTNSVAITVSLNPEPNDLEFVTVKRANAKVAINGNGKTIDGESQVVLSRKYTGLDLVYTVEADSWSIV